MYQANFNIKESAFETLISENKVGTSKAQHCANGSPQREWMTQEAVSSPTVRINSTLLTAVFEAEERREEGCYL